MPGRSKRKEQRGNRFLTGRLWISGARPATAAAAGQRAWRAGIVAERPAGRPDGPSDQDGLARRRYSAGVGPTAARNARWKCGWSL